MQFKKNNGIILKAWKPKYAVYNVHEGSNPDVILAGYKLISAQGTAVKPPYILIASIIGYSPKWRRDDNGVLPMTTIWYKTLLGLNFECTSGKQYVHFQGKLYG